MLEQDSNVFCAAVTEGETRADYDHDDRMEMDAPELPRSEPPQAFAIQVSIFRFSK